MAKEQKEIQTTRFTIPNRHSSAPLTKWTSPPRIRKVDPPKPPKEYSEARVKGKTGVDLGEVIAGVFMLGGIISTPVRPPETAYVMEIDQDGQWQSENLTFAGMYVQSVAEQVDEADIAPALLRSNRTDGNLRIEIVIKTDGSKEEIEAIAEVLKSMEGIEDQGSEDGSIWVSIVDKVVPALKTTAKILGGIWATGKIVMFVSAVIGVNLATSEEDVISVSGCTSKKKKDTKLAKGIKTTGDMSKALSSLADALELMR